MISLTFGCLWLMACGGGGDDTSDAVGRDGQPYSGASATPEDICENVFECGGYGWPSEAECQSGWVGSSKLGTECPDESAYFDCMGPCVELGCDDFTPCETACWTDHCL